MPDGTYAGLFSGEAEVTALTDDLLELTFLGSERCELATSGADTGTACSPVDAVLTLTGERRVDGSTYGGTPSPMLDANGTPICHDSPGGATAECPP